MGTKLKYQTVIKKILSEYAQYKPAYGNIESRISFDDEHGSYALLQVGWEEDEYVHGAVVHIDLIGEKVWVQYDGTEEGVSEDLVEAGIPREAIVLGFRPIEIRQYTGFATV
jgi:hypothetical protein